MAKKGALWHTDKDLPIQSQIDLDKKTWSEVEKLAVETSKLDFDGYAQPAISVKSSGRNCPKCANRLRVKERTDNGIIVLNCWNCHSTWHNTDLESVYETDENGKTVIDSVTDNMYRSIPDTDVHYWMSFLERKKK